jgi:hypothetical protein
VAGHAFDVTIRAPREVVFDVLTDHVGYAAITPVELEREGDPAPNGTGAVRVMRPLGRLGPGTTLLWSLPQVVNRRRD